MKFVDSNIFIYHLANDPAHGNRATAILSRIEKGEEAATSTLMVSQVCAYLRWKKSQDKIPIFLRLLQSLPSLLKDETTFLDFTAAIQLQRRLGASWRLWDDLVTACQMSRLRVKEIYSNDADFEKIPGINRVF